MRPESYLLVFNWNLDGTLHLSDLFFFSKADSKFKCGVRELGRTGIVYSAVDETDYETLQAQKPRTLTYAT